MIGGTSMSKTHSIALTDGKNDYTVIFGKNGAQVYKKGKELTDVNWTTIAATIVSEFVYDEP